MQPYTLGSRYVINADGSFALVIDGYELRGRYTEAEGRITFDFEWNNQAAGATGYFVGDAMTVTYNTMMSLSDFENGVYVRVVN